MSIVPFILNKCDASTDDLIKGHLSHVFAVLPYNIPTAIFGKFFNIISTFAWNFMDLFVILNSIGMANTFKQLSDYICQESRNASIKIYSIQSYSYKNVASKISFCLAHIT